MNTMGKDFRTKVNELKRAIRDYASVGLTLGGRPADITGESDYTALEWDAAKKEVVEEDRQWTEEKKPESVKRVNEIEQTITWELNGTSEKNLLTLLHYVAHLDAHRTASAHITKTVRKGHVTDVAVELVLTKEKGFTEYYRISNNYSPCMPLPSDQEMLDWAKRSLAIYLAKEQRQKPEPAPEPLSPCEEIRRAHAAQDHLLDVYRELGWHKRGEKASDFFFVAETCGTKPNQLDDATLKRLVEEGIHCRKEIDRQMRPRSPQCPEPKKGGTKFDDGKVRWDLLPWDPLEQVVLALMYGAEKYEIGNWEKGYSWRKMASAGFRHFTAWLRGQKRDPDSGLNPLAHVGACVLFLLHYDIHRDRYKDFDDRFINNGGGHGRS